MSFLDLYASVIDAVEEALKNSKPPAPSVSLERVKQYFDEYNSADWTNSQFKDALDKLIKLGIIKEANQGTIYVSVLVDKYTNPENYVDKHIVEMFEASDILGRKHTTIVLETASDAAIILEYAARIGWSILFINNGVGLFEKDK